MPLLLDVENWLPSSWRTKAARQMPAYSDPQTLARVFNQLSENDPLTTVKDIEILRSRLVAASRGQVFLIQAGDCAEHFTDADADVVANKLHLVNQLEQIFRQRTGRDVVMIARIAGQYAKPRTHLFETREGVTLPSYRGDLINGAQFSPTARAPNPERMIDGYFYARKTLKYMKASSHIFSSHEALLLPFEEALTRYSTKRNGWYNLSTHFPWIGMRTAVLHEAHVEYLRGIRNPIGVKVGIAMTPTNLAELVRRLNPENEPGKLVLIHRLGVGYVQRLLPQLLRSVQQTGLNVLWMCDPMHGNTFVTQNGFKTRHFSDILADFAMSYAIHQELGIPLAGLHCEMTHESVTECMGGELDIREEDLGHRYKSLVDPRLAPAQALELVTKVADILA